MSVYALALSYTDKLCCMRLEGMTLDVPQPSLSGKSYGGQAAPRPLVLASSSASGTPTAQSPASSVSPAFGAPEALSSPTNLSPTSPFESIRLVPGSAELAPVVPEVARDDSPMELLEITANGWIVASCLRQDFGLPQKDIISKYLDGEFRRIIAFYATLQEVMKTLSYTMMAEIFTEHPQRVGIRAFLQETIDDRDFHEVAQEKGVDFSSYIDQKFLDICLSDQTDKYEVMRSMLFEQYKSEVTAKKTILTAVSKDAIAQDALCIILRHPYAKKIITDATLLTILDRLVQRYEHVKETVELVLAEIAMRDLIINNTLSRTRLRNLKLIGAHAARPSTHKAVEGYTGKSSRSASIKKFMQTRASSSHKSEKPSSSDGDEGKEAGGPKKESCCNSDCDCGDWCVIL